MNGPRASNIPAGGQASSPPVPASAQSASGVRKDGEGTSSPNYQNQCDADNPPPEVADGSKWKVKLANCQFVTPVNDLKLNEELEFSVEITKLAEPKTRRAYFSLFCTRTREGKEERARIWASKEAFPADDKAVPMVARSKGVLATQSDYILGEKVAFQLEVRHDEAEEICKSPVIEVRLMTKAFWLGGESIAYRPAGEFPRFGDAADLIRVLYSALRRVEKPPQIDAETTICFGFASSTGSMNPNRQLSLRRAKVIKSILERDSVTWTDLAESNFETIDMQQFLADLHSACGWACNPGNVDGKDGPKTKAAIEAFQSEVNSRFKMVLKVDGICGPKTWKAVLRVIHGYIQDAMGQDPAKEPSWKKPKWGRGGSGVYACGEDYSSGGEKSEERTVQITFFSPGSQPALLDVAEGEKPKPDSNPVQDPEKVQKIKLELLEILADELEEWEFSN